MSKALERGAGILLPISKKTTGVTDIANQATANLKTKGTAIPSSGIGNRCTTI